MKQILPCEIGNRRPQTFDGLTSIEISPPVYTKVYRPINREVYQQCKMHLLAEMMKKREVT